jgi:hypothetical protein
MNTPVSLLPSLRRVLQVAAVCALAACGGGSGAEGAGGPPPPEDTNPGRSPGSEPSAPSVEQQLAEKPWEVVSSKGETYLPNVFYADASQNEQVMPVALDGHVMIDRLIYPTLGNPNLYTRSDPKDEFMVVLRIEERAYAFLDAAPSSVPGSSLTRLQIPNDPKTGFAFFLVPRDARDANTESTHAISSGSGTGVYRIYPNDVLMNPVPADMPASLRLRNTLRFVFKQGAMAKVPPGLYDVRFELRRDDAIEDSVYEYQYNAVRVFDTEPEEHSIINVTDTQVSVGSLYDSKTKEKLEQFVQYVNTTDDPNVRAASFITFNGDLHNGGSPGSLRQRTVANTYNAEAKTIVDTLKYLPLPIFLTTGNHDGYVSTGQVPGAVKTADDALSDDLEKVTNDASPKAWPGFTWSGFKTYIDETAAADELGGWHRDLYVGAFSRSSKGSTFSESWKEIPREQRNEVLYDGFYQWRKTYGPLYYSYKFGKTFYVSLNSFELRQHRRAGWGMYTVNYGGGMSDVQLAWLDRELLRAKTDRSDVVLLAHHDPRGGHKGLDQGYYFDLLEYESVWQSAINYLAGKAWDPAVCQAPDWVLSRDQQDSCVHDGLQEWMGPDEDFDCAWDDRNAQGLCDESKLFFSGVELMKRITRNPEVRTVLLGHTHYNSLEVLQTGDELLPGQFPVDDDKAKQLAGLEIQNPFRGYAVQQRHARLAGARFFARDADYTPSTLPVEPIARRVKELAAMYDRAAPAAAERTLDAPMGHPRELVIMRLVSNADLANQKYQGQSALGFAVLHLTSKSDVRAYDNPQINEVTFFVNKGGNVFDDIETAEINRNAHLGAHDSANPIQQTYTW